MDVNDQATIEDVPMEEDDSDESSDDGEDDDKMEKKVYLPGKPLEEGEELTYDESAYVMLHQAHTGAPCLSFDVITDNYGSSRTTFPMSGYIVAGTQAAKAHANSLIVLKMSNLHRTSREKTESDDDDDSELSDEEDDDDHNSKKPQMTCALVNHQGCINRVRTTTVDGNVLAASWSELGRVNIWNINDELKAIDDPAEMKTYEKDGKGNAKKPLYSFSGHRQEGFAMDWSTTAKGTLATGDCCKDIHIWQPTNATWNVDQKSLIGHTDSVEDLQWSPNERSVLASCSVDKSIRIWDCRAPPSKACMLTCENSHDSDVNVISWNRNDPLIVSGGDDGLLHIWDLRQFQTKKPIASFKHHTNHVTTVEWNPLDSTVFASGGADDQIAIWDLAVERDTEVSSSFPDEQESSVGNDNELNNLPSQLLFIHQGQTDIKELHWHHQLPGVIISTSHSGLNIFKTISV